ncbi:MAG: type II toxin-antitoxin system VapC family toxin [Actinobacteria bacterium]|nr:type II toxin-antitoxin system VapC family toxin [Actinomycetota bacterium]
MRYLLDTHALIWFISDADRLSDSAAEAIRDGPEVYASHVSLWEMVTKSRAGTLNVEGSLFTGVGAWFETNVPKAQLAELPISAGHLAAVEFLPDHHRDPFDRLLIAQATTERLTFITNDELIKPYGIETLW